MKKIYMTIFFCFALMITYAQTPKPAVTPPMSYGVSVTMGQAEKMMAAAILEASRNNWLMAIAIVDTGGNLVAFQRMDNTQIGSIDVALAKAKTANNFKRPTKAFEDIIAGGGAGLRLLSAPGVIALEGGEPIIFQGKIIGAIGVSGMKATEDDQVAKAGIAALN